VQGNHAVNRNKIRIVTGDLFKSECQTLINAVNCAGVMGKGIALEFKRRYPAMFKQYTEDCKTGKLAIGKPSLIQSAIILLPLSVAGICWNAYRVMRGGSWNNSARNCRATNRNRRRPDNRNRNQGFRVGLFPSTPWAPK